MATPFIRGHILSYTDHPGLLSLVFYTDLNKCNLDCYCCHNKFASKNMKKPEFYKTSEVISIINDSKILGIDLIIICGGEPTFFVNELKEKLIKIRNIVNLPIRIDTNGQLPDKIEELKSCCDGFAVDLKIPIKGSYNIEESMKYSEIIGSYDLKTYSDNLLRTINIVKDMKYTIFRTVRYPQLSEEEIRFNYNLFDFKDKYYFLDFYNFNYHKLIGDSVYELVESC